MRPPNLQIYPNLETLSQAAATLLAALATRSLAARGSFYIAISGGSTPGRLYQILAQEPYHNKVFGRQTHIFWCDERIVPPNHTESNFGQVYEILFSKVDLPANCLHRIHGELAPSQAVLDYARQLKVHAGVGLDWPRFDLVLLGLGTDGHTASLFPGSNPRIGDGAPVLWVAEDYEGRPANRITLTQLVFNSARQIVFLVSGKNKASALAGTLSSPPNPLLWPAQRIQPIDGSLLWMVDEDAACLVESDSRNSPNPER